MVATRLRQFPSRPSSGSVSGSIFFITDGGNGKRQPLHGRPAAACITPVQQRLFKLARSNISGFVLFFLAGRQKFESENLVSSSANPALPARSSGRESGGPKISSDRP
ncbi:hypothetical protein ACLOJK_016438 [Asimina triloba]